MPRSLTVFPSGSHDLCDDFWDDRVSWRGANGDPEFFSPALYPFGFIVYSDTKVVKSDCGLMLVENWQIGRDKRTIMQSSSCSVCDTWTLKHQKAERAYLQQARSCANCWSVCCNPRLIISTGKNRHRWKAPCPPFQNLTAWGGEVILPPVGPTSPLSVTSWIGRFPLHRWKQRSSPFWRRETETGKQTPCFLLFWFLLSWSCTEEGSCQWLKHSCPCLKVPANVVKSPTFERSLQTPEMLDLHTQCVCREQVQLG